MQSPYLHSCPFMLTTSHYAAQNTRFSTSFFLNSILSYDTSLVRLQHITNICDIARGIGTVAIIVMEVTTLPAFVSSCDANSSYKQYPISVMDLKPWK